MTRLSVVPRQLETIPAVPNVIVLRTELPRPIDDDEVPRARDVEWELHRAWGAVRAAERDAHEAEVRMERALSRLAEVEALFAAFGRDHHQIVLELTRQRDEALAEAELARKRLRLVDPFERRALLDDAVEKVMFGRTREGLADLRLLADIDPTCEEIRAWVAHAEGFVRWEEEALGLTG